MIHIQQLWKCYRESQMHPSAGIYQQKLEREAFYEGAQAMREAMNLEDEFEIIARHNRAASIADALDPDAKQRKLKLVKPGGSNRKPV